MNREPIEEWLCSVRDLNKELASIHKEIDFFYKYNNYVGDPDTRISAYKKRAEFIMRQKVLLADIVWHIEDPIARIIFRCRYILGYTWGEIAKNHAHQCERNVHLIHKRTLPEVQKLYEKFVLVNEEGSGE